MNITQPNNSDSKPHRIAMLYSDIVKVALYLLFWTIVAFAGLAVGYFAFRAIWVGLQFSLRSLGI